MGTGDLKLDVSVTLKPKLITLCCSIEKTKHKLKRLFNDSCKVRTF